MAEPEIGGFYLFPNKSIGRYLGNYGQNGVETKECRIAINQTTTAVINIDYRLKFRKISLDYKGRARCYYAWITLKGLKKAKRIGTEYILHLLFNNKKEIDRIKNEPLLNWEAYK